MYINILYYVKKMNNFLIYTFPLSSIFFTSTPYVSRMNFGNIFLTFKTILVELFKHFKDNKRYSCPASSNIFSSN